MISYLFRGTTVVFVLFFALFVAVTNSQAQSIELATSDDHIVCWGMEPFWSLDHQGNAGEWRSYDSFGDVTQAVSGSFGVAGGAYGPIALWRGQAVEADGAGGADYVIIAEPAAISTPPSSVSRMQTRHMLAVGVDRRRISSTALGISSGFSLRRASWSGFSIRR